MAKTATEAKEPEVKVEIACSWCEKKNMVNPTVAGNARLPKGWKRDQEDRPVCNVCWRGKYRVAAVRLTIASVEVAEGEDKKEAWSTFKTALVRAWFACRVIANWAIREMAKLEPTFDPRATKDEKYTIPYLYGMGIPWDRWDLGTGSVVALLGSVQKKYLADRREVFKGEKSLSSIRSMPLPLGAAEVRLSREGPQRIPMASFRVGGRRWKVRLAGGKRQKWNLQQLDHVVENPDCLRECQLMNDKKNRQVAFKVVAWMPRTKNDVVDKTFRVVTAPDSFLVGALVGDDRPWILNGEHVRGWNAEFHRKTKIAGNRHKANPEVMGVMEPERTRTAINEHAVASQRLREDMKWEKRRTPGARKLMGDRFERMCDKQNNRLKTWCQQVASMVVGYASRNKCSHLVFDCTEQSYVKPFPWHMLKDDMAQASDKAGIIVDIIDKSKEVAAAAARARATAAGEAEPIDEE